ncbi:hypothetical protein ASE01_23700 [Nocardioides sp. Root190]|nr:hypothetical protein ASE01_23700 [Nocardioides sp. Root190]
MVIFVCARKGKVVASINLSTIDPEDEDAGEGLPRALKRLVRASGDDVDPEAIALAMVEEFTGICVDPGVLGSGEIREITPLPDDLDPYDADYLPSHLKDYPDLVDLLLALDPERQRVISKAATRIAVAEAGMSAEPSIAEVLDDFDRLAVPGSNPGVGLLDGAIARRSDELSLREIDTGVYGCIELYHVFQQAWAVNAIRQSTNTNPLSAALACCNSAIVAASCAKLERGEQLVEDERGGRLVETHDPTAARTAAVVNALTAMARDDSPTWAQHLAGLPAPLTTAERERAIADDRRREAAGDFTEYKIVND